MIIDVFASNAIDYFQELKITFSENAMNADFSATFHLLLKLLGLVIHQENRVLKNLSYNDNENFVKTHLSWIYVILTLNNIFRQWNSTMNDKFPLADFSYLFQFLVIYDEIFGNFHPYHHLEWRLHILAKTMCTLYVMLEKRSLYNSVWIPSPSFMSEIVPGAR